MASAGAVAGSRNGPLKASLSSPHWQIFLFLHGYYMASLVFVECLVFIWKGSVLPYPDDILAVEIILLFVVGGLETARLFWGMKGNLTERRLATFISISMALTSLTGALYFVLWQTYVLYIEAIIFIIHMALIVLETILAIVTFAAVQKSINLQNPVR